MTMSRKMRKFDTFHANKKYLLPFNIYYGQNKAFMQPENTIFDARKSNFADKRVILRSKKLEPTYI